MVRGKPLGGSLRFLLYVASSHCALKSDLGSRSFHFSITNGFPPRTTWRKTSFSNSWGPMFRICAADIRRTQWKFGVRSTRLCKSRSGGIGSNFAWGCCAVGIVPVAIATATATATATVGRVDELGSIQSQETSKVEVSKSDGEVEIYDGRMCAVEHVATTGLAIPRSMRELWLREARIHR